MLLLFICFYFCGCLFSVRLASSYSCNCFAMADFLLYDFLAATVAAPSLFLLKIAACMVASMTLHCLALEGALAAVFLSSHSFLLVPTMVVLLMAVLFAVIFFGLLCPPFLQISPFVCLFGGLFFHFFKKCLFLNGFLLFCYISF